MKLVLIVLLIGAFSYGTVVFAQELNSSNFQIENYSVGTLETANATSTNFVVDYANDATLIYDEPTTPTTAGGSSGSSGSRRTSSTETLTPVQTTVNEQLPSETTQQPTPFISPPKYYPTSKPVSKEQTETISSFDDGIEVSFGNSIRLQYHASGSPETETVRGVFSDGTIGMVSVTSDSFPVGTDITFIITKILFDQQLKPYERTLVLTDRYMYRIDAVDSAEQPIYVFKNSVKFAILFTGKSIASDATSYGYVPAERMWSILPEYTVGRNVISFYLKEPALVSFWNTDGDIVNLPLDQSQNDSQVATSTMSSEDESGILNKLPMLLMLAGGILLFLLLLILWLVLRKKRKKNE